MDCDSENKSMQSVIRLLQTELDNLISRENLDVLFFGKFIELLMLSSCMWPDFVLFAFVCGVNGQS